MEEEGRNKIHDPYPQNKNCQSSKKLFDYVAFIPSALFPSFFFNMFSLLIYWVFNVCQEV